MAFGNETWLWPMGGLFLLWFGWTLFSFFQDQRDLKELGYQNLILSPEKVLFRRVLKGFLLLASLFMVVLGAARLQGKLIPQDMTARGSDIIVVLDVSKSMLTQDVNPDRLGAAKQALEGWMNNLEGDRVGLVVFAGQALVQVPLTLDLDTVSMILDKADPDTVELGGTDIGVGIRMALSAFPKDSKRGKAILLMTDGEATKGASSVEEACQEAKAMNVPIITVGMGTREGKPIPDGVSFFTGEPIFKKDSFGNTHISHLDEATLNQIADSTGGVFIHGDSASNLSKINGTIDRLAKSEITSHDTMRREELSPVFGLLAASGLILSSIL